MRRYFKKVKIYCQYYCQNLIIVHIMMLRSFCEWNWRDCAWTGSGDGSTSLPHRDL